MLTHLLSCLAPLGLKSAHVSASVTPVFQFILGMAMMVCKDLRISRMSASQEYRQEEIPHNRITLIFAR